MNVLYQKNWTAMISEPIQRLENKLLNELIRGSHAKDIQLFLRSKQEWSLTSSILYSVTIITTTGNNRLYMNTRIGKVVTMLYALIGIPLTFFCISNMGLLLTDLLRSANRTFTTVLGNTNKRCTCRNYSTNDEHRNKLSGEHEKSIRKKDIMVCVDSKQSHENVILHRSQNCAACQIEEFYNNKSGIGDSLKSTTVPKKKFDNDCCPICRSNQIKLNISDKKTPITERRTGRGHTRPSRRYHRKYVFFNNGPKISTTTLSLILGTYICLSAVIVSVWKSKPLLKTLYFCFAVASTSFSINEIFFDNAISPNTVELIIYTINLFLSVVLMYCLFFTLRKYQTKCKRNKRRIICESYRSRNKQY